MDGVFRPSPSLEMKNRPISIGGRLKVGEGRATENVAGTEARPKARSIRTILFESGQTRELKPTRYTNDTVRSPSADSKIHLRCELP